MSSPLGVPLPPGQGSGGNNNSGQQQQQQNQGGQRRSGGGGGGNRRNNGGRGGVNSYYGPASSQQRSSADPRFGGLGRGGPMGGRGSPGGGGGRGMDPRMPMGGRGPIHGQRQQSGGGPPPPPPPMMGGFQGGPGRGGHPMGGPMPGRGISRPSPPGPPQQHPPMGGPMGNIPPPPPLGQRGGPGAQAHMIGAPMLPPPPPPPQQQHMGQTQGLGPGQGRMPPPPPPPGQGPQQQMGPSGQGQMQHMGPPGHGIPPPPPRQNLQGPPGQGILVLPQRSGQGPFGPPGMPPRPPGPGQGPSGMGGTGQGPPGMPGPGQRLSGQGMLGQGPPASLVRGQGASGLLGISRILGRGQVPPGLPGQGPPVILGQGQGLPGISGPQGRGQGPPGSSGPGPGQGPQGPPGQRMGPPGPPLPPPSQQQQHQRKQQQHQGIGGPPPWAGGGGPPPPGQFGQQGGPPAPPQQHAMPPRGILPRSPPGPSGPSGQIGHQQLSAGTSNQGGPPLPQARMPQGHMGQNHIPLPPSNHPNQNAPPPLPSGQGRIMPPGGPRSEPPGSSQVRGGFPPPSHYMRQGSGPMLGQALLQGSPQGPPSHHIGGQGGGTPGHMPFNPDFGLANMRRHGNHSLGPGPGPTGPRPHGPPQGPHYGAPHSHHQGGLPPDGLSQGNQQPPPYQHSIALTQQLQHGAAPSSGQSPMATSDHPQQSVQISDPSAAPVPSPTKDPAEDAKNWTTHKAPSGVNYYYNSVTKVSTYSQPSCMPSVGDSAINTATGANDNTSGTVSTGNSNGASAAPKVEGKTSGSSKWKTYADKASGRRYYHNGVTTTWDRPTDYESDSDGTAESPTIKKRKSSKTLIVTDDGDAHSAGGEDSSQKKKKKKASASSSKKIKAENVTWCTKAEATAAFKGLLLAKDIGPTTKWNEVVRLCSSDSRWEACSTMGERKQALAEYQTKRANEIREQRRKESARAKDAFSNLLTEVLPTVRDFHPHSQPPPRFSDVRDAISKDDRFYAVEEEATREELFYDFVEELRKRDERKRRGRKREARDAFVAFLKDREERGGLTFASTWASFLASLDDSDRKDPRFAPSAAMSEQDRQLYFADYVIDLQAAEDEKRRKIREARRRAEKAQRDAYRSALRAMAIDGKILPSTRWRNIEDAVSAHDSFGPVQAQGREAPREMFEDFVDDWAEDYRRDRSFLSRLASVSTKASRVEVTVDTSYEDFTKGLLDLAAHSPEQYSDVRRVLNREEPVSSARLYFNELVLRAKEAAELAAKSFRAKVGYGGRGGRRGSSKEAESSEDEGEIKEDGEVNDN